LTIQSSLFQGLWDYYIVISILVSVFTFTWLYHHSFWYRSEDSDGYDNPDEIAVGVFPKHNDDMRLEVAWTVAPFMLIVWLTYVSWVPLDAVWSETGEDGYHGEECEDGQSSNNQLDGYGVVTSECYHVIEITAKQWVWAFDCLDLSTELCDTGSDNVEVYGTVPLLSLKKGETYLANMRSEDVTHAPWFLGMGVKEDTLYGAEIGPSEYEWPTTLWLPISSEVGDQIILCTEYCGDAHSVMAGKLVVHQ